MQKCQKLDAENARLRERIKRQDEDNTQLKMQVQALTTNLTAVKKDKNKPHTGSHVRVDCIGGGNATSSTAPPPNTKKEDTACSSAQNALPTNSQPAKCAT